MQNETNHYSCCGIFSRDVIVKYGYNVCGCACYGRV